MISDMQTRGTLIDIDLTALAHNFSLIKQCVAPAQVMPIVKGNAYGHGMVEVAKHLEKEGAQWLGVALVEEGVVLRNSGINTNIVVLGAILNHQISLFLEHDLQITAASVAKLEAIDQEARALNKRAKVHIEIDTGMERTGVHYYSASQLIAQAVQTSHCDFVGVSSHFATCEDEDISFMRVQLARFLEAIGNFSQHDLKVPIRHIAASGAIMQDPTTHLDLVRPGLMLYGIAPAKHLQDKWDLHPVMQLRSKVVYFKVVRQGDTVSYGRLWKTRKDTRVVTVPFGYGDGYSRLLAQGAHVLIRGKRYPIIGRMCMDQFMVDIGDGEAYNGDEVVVIGQQGNDKITVEELTNRLIDGNAREITTSLNTRIPRRYVL